MLQPVASKTRFHFLFVTSIFFFCFIGPNSCLYLSSRTVTTKYGLLRGVIVQPRNRNLKPVEAFFGVPFAFPPVKLLRFMPPRGPLPWSGTKIADQFGPVCPQTFPNYQHEKLFSKYTNYFLPFLKNESEDCLYLNIYLPLKVAQGKRTKLAVMVYIHGESYSWNSGNTYDASLFASHEEIIVVTLNYRLGILGFLKLGNEANTATNFGLFDQIAALQWVQENISEFGGDPKKITLAGQGTGASCVSLIAMSSVAKGLIKRVILMSGSSFSPWSIVDDPIRIASEVGRKLECQVSVDYDERISCFRNQPLSEILKVKIENPNILIPFGPVIDDVLINQDPRKRTLNMQRIPNYIDLLGGVVFSHINTLSLNPQEIFLVNRTMKNMSKNEVQFFNLFPFLAYKDISTSVTNLYGKTLEIFSHSTSSRLKNIFVDFNFASAIIAEVDAHVSEKKNTFLYVFSKNATTENNQFLEKIQPLNEVPYMFGYPLVENKEFQESAQFSRNDEILSEIMTTYWGNFIKTGNPNFPSDNLELNWNPNLVYTNVKWPNYDKARGTYLQLGLPLVVKDNYRSEYMLLWNKVVPELMEKHKMEASDIKKVENFNGFNVLGCNSDVINRLIRRRNKVEKNSLNDTENYSIAHSSMNVVIAAGVCLLILNLLIYLGMFHQRQRTKRFFSQSYLLPRRREHRCSMSSVSNKCEYALNKSDEQCESCSETERSSLFNDISLVDSIKGKLEEAFVETETPLKARLKNAPDLEFQTATSSYRPRNESDKEAVPRPPLKLENFQCNTRESQKSMFGVEHTLSEEPFSKPKSKFEYFSHTMPVLNDSVTKNSGQNGDEVRCKSASPHQMNYVCNAALDFNKVNTTSQTDLSGFDPLYEQLLNSHNSSRKSNRKDKTVLFLDADFADMKKPRYQ